MADVLLFKEQKVLEEEGFELPKTWIDEEEAAEVSAAEKHTTR